MLEERKTALRARLAAERSALLALVDALSDEQWQHAVFAEEQRWSVGDIVGHVERAERSMIQLIRLICSGGEGASPDFDLNRYNRRQVEKNRDRTRADIRQGLEENRASLLELLQSLSADELALQGRHGSGHIMSNEQIIKTIYRHDRTHAEHIRTALELPL